jgi:hypothetical protein
MSSSEPTPAARPITTNRGTNAVRPVVLGLAVTVLALTGLGLQKSRTPHADERFCAGVGLMGPTAASPDQALAAWLAPQGADSSAWERAAADEDGTSTSVGFRPIEPADHRFETVTAGLVGGTWSIRGGCVSAAMTTSP